MMTNLDADIPHERTIPTARDTVTTLTAKPFSTVYLGRPSGYVKTQDTLDPKG